MFENDNITFMVANENGEAVECEVLFTFESDETGKHYIVYTDHMMDDDGTERVYASSYDPDDKYGELIPVEDDEDWETIAGIIDALLVENMENMELEN